MWSMASSNQFSTMQKKGDISAKTQQEKLPQTIDSINIFRTEKYQHKPIRGIIVN